MKRKQLRERKTHKEKEGEAKQWVGRPPNYLTKDETESGASAPNWRRKSTLKSLRSQFPRQSETYYSPLSLALSLWWSEWWIGFRVASWTPWRAPLSPKLPIMRLYVFCQCTCVRICACALTFFLVVDHSDRETWKIYFQSSQCSQR